MATLKLFGFSTDEINMVHQEATLSSWELATNAHARMERADNHIWVVNIFARERFLRDIFPMRPGEHATDNLHSPKAVLWVPKKQPSLPFSEWSEIFHDQLEASNVEDIAFLERVSRCSQVFEWNERVTDYRVQQPPDRRTSTLDKYISDFPFPKEEKTHLMECADCRTEVRLRIVQQVELSRMILCPSTEEIGTWLNGQSDSYLEKHILRCKTCQHSLTHLTEFVVNAGLLTSEQVNTKLAAVQIRNPEVLQVWLQAQLQWQLTSFVRAVAMAFSPMAVMSRRRSSLIETSTEVSPIEDMVQRLGSNEPVILMSEDRWLLLKAEGEDVLVRAGHSMANRFHSFRVEFRYHELNIISIEASEGIARITQHHWERARQAQVDEIVIVREPEAEEQR